MDAFFQNSVKLMVHNDFKSLKLEIRNDFKFSKTEISIAKRNSCKVYFKKKKSHIFFIAIGIGSLLWLTLEKEILFNVMEMQKWMVKKERIFAK